MTEVMGYAPANGSFRPLCLSLRDLTKNHPPATRKFVKAPRTPEQKLAEWTRLAILIGVFLSEAPRSIQELLLLLPDKYETDIKGALCLLGAISYSSGRGRPKWRLP